MTPSQRLQPWPEWATRYYWEFRNQIGRLEAATRWLLDKAVAEQNVPRLERFLPMLEEIARMIHLTSLELNEQRDSNKWPNWANNAHALIMSRSKRSAEKVQQARRYLDGNYWTLMELRLRDALLFSQEMRAALMEGPTPELKEQDIFVMQLPETMKDKDWVQKLSEN